MIPSSTPAPTAAAPALVPPFEHIVIIVLENKEFGVVYGSAKMPYFNQLVRAYTLLTQHYAVAHPSLPNYLAMIGGDTFGITFDCDVCFIDAQTLPDLIEASGRTWKTYQEDMPSPCYPQPYAGNYAIKHNPFLYFKAIRLDASRCARSVVPFTQLSADLASGALPNFIFITPNLCNDAHDCELQVADDWLKGLMVKLLPALDADGKPYLVIITWDEGQGDHSCCGLPKAAGGRIATLLVSPQARAGFLDDTPYTHYSILKTIEEAWHLQYLGHSADAENMLITAPWK
jgi:phospholipase C